MLLVISSLFMSLIYAPYGAARRRRLSLKISTTHNKEPPPPCAVDIFSLRFACRSTSPDMSRRYLHAATPLPLTFSRCYAGAMRAQQYKSGYDARAVRAKSMQAAGA